MSHGTTVATMVFMALLMGVVRSNILILCDFGCRPPSTYATPPTNLRELSWYKISEQLQEVVGGARLTYISNIYSASDTSVSLQLVASTIRDAANGIDTIVSVSDLLILPQLPLLVYDSVGPQAAIDLIVISSRRVGLQNLTSDVDEENVLDGLAQSAAASTAR
jgi:hypothetical protein